MHWKGHAVKDSVDESQITTINPYTAKPIKSYDLMSRDEAFAAAERCHEAFLDWRGVSLQERARIIGQIGEKLIEKSDDFSALMTEETGKLLKDGKTEVQLCAGICKWTAEAGPKELADETRDVENGEKGHIAYSPIGVIYGIQPWNFPAYQAIRYTIANLMAGNGVLLKHAASCTGAGLFLRDLMEEAGLPKHLFTVLVIDHDISDEVIAHDKVRGVTLTGSSDAGRHVAAKAGAALKKTVMELGSNDAYLVLSDADLDLAVKTCVMGRIYNNGQTCVNAKRFVVVDAVYDDFIAAYVKEMSDIEMGDPSDKATKLGPMSRKELRDKLHDQVWKSIAKGAKLSCGGHIPDRRGAFYPATVLEDVAPGQPAYDEELFGPVASVIRAKDDEDAMRIANDSKFGLGGGIFSRDVERAVTLARDEFDTGMVFVNGFNVATPNMPFGGVKNSGYGREHGGFGMKEFVNVKTIIEN
ncbi:NAD-dependent succinate-semialdehyde dehydrogenase [Maritimibacter sp. DP1N21-5]|uniref:NAD-dependent succinate-semialdehyde dehydrogenase n=1 Tax=Maritimibacter sp. DP1N21-5 TaxID=2836867 RepID=UPI001C46E534|nr:NAD-dependent succinate-semialdehyde dehydrogenase [Maritimibacter sp. DP1N21-5]